MPFLTYSLDSKIIDNIESFKTRGFNRFINDVEKLNRKKRAILIDENNNIVDKILKIYEALSKKNKTIEDDLLSEVIMQAKSILRDSYLCRLKKNNEMNIKIDFNKDLDNELDIELFNKFSEGTYDTSSSFKKSVEVFKKEFLEKIKVFMASQNTEERKINTIHIFHKELADYLLPWKEINGRKVIILDQEIEKSLKDNKIKSIKKKDGNYSVSYYSKNAAKIKEGIKVLYNWWKNLPDFIRPKKFILHTDPGVRVQGMGFVKYDRYKAKSRFENFLFNDLEKFNAEINFIDKRELEKQGYNGSDWWKHKRHFAFGKEVSLLIWAEYGVEFVVPENNLELQEKVKFTILGEDIEIEHRKEIKEVAKKFP